MASDRSALGDGLWQLTFQDQDMQVFGGIEVAYPYISNVELDESFLIPEPQRLTRLSGAPLSITSLNSPIGLDEFAPVVRTDSSRCSVKYPDGDLDCSTEAAFTNALSRQYFCWYSFRPEIAQSASTPTAVPAEVLTLGRYWCSMTNLCAGNSCCQ